MTIYNTGTYQGRLFHSSMIPLTTRTYTKKHSDSAAFVPRTMDVIHGPYTWDDRFSGKTLTVADWACWPDWRYCAFTMRYRPFDFQNPVPFAESTAAITSWNGSKTSRNPVFTGSRSQMSLVIDPTYGDRGVATMCPVPRPEFGTTHSDANYPYYSYGDLFVEQNVSAALGNKYNYTANDHFFYRANLTAIDYSDALWNARTTHLDGFHPLYMLRLNDVWGVSNSILSMNQVYFPEHYMIFSTSSQIDARCFYLEIQSLATDSSTKKFDAGQVSHYIDSGDWRGISRMKCVDAAVGRSSVTVSYRSRESSTVWSGEKTLYSSALGYGGCMFKYLGQFGTEHFYLARNAVENPVTVNDYNNPRTGKHLSVTSTDVTTQESMPTMKKYLYITPPCLTFNVNETGASGNYNPYVPLNTRLTIWEWGVGFWGGPKHGGWADPSVMGNLWGWKHKLMTP